MEWELALRIPTGLKNCGLGSPAGTGISPHGQLIDGTGLCLRPGAGTRPRSDSLCPPGKTIRTLSLLPVGR